MNMNKVILALVAVVIEEVARIVIDEIRN